MTSAARPGSEAEREPGDSLASRLQWLLERVPDPSTGERRKAYSYQGVSDAIRRRDELLPEAAREARAVSKQYFAHLVVGRMSNPTVPKLEALAGLFAVPVAFLQPGGADDAAVVEAVTSRFRRETDAELARQKLMFRARDLGPEDIALVMDTITWIQQQRRSDANRPPSPPA